MSKKFAVVLSGCGVYDGSEIHEAVMTLLAIDRANCTYQCFAPDLMQYHVVNHITGDVQNENRNILIESARIARGKIKDLKEFNAADFDGLVFPGGYGAAKNLSSLAFDGANLMVIDQVKTAIHSMVQHQKPIGALCIAPVVMAAVLEGAEVTIGKDKGTISTIESLGGKHIETGNGEVVIDNKYKLVTNPCYMLKASITQIAEGAQNVINEMLKL